MLPFSSRSRQPVVGTVSRFLKALHVKVSEGTVEDRILSHPDYPSLLAVSDCLHRWKVENVAVRVDPSQLDDISLPFMAHAHSDFMVVIGISGEQVILSDENGKEQAIDKKVFLQLWDGVVLIAEPEADAGEKNYAKEQRKQNGRLIPALVFLVALSGIIALSAGLPGAGARSEVGYGILVLAKLAGIVITGALLWYEIDKYNPAIQKLCMGGSGKKTDCNAILNSDHSKLFAWLSWGEVGWIYFTGSLLYLLCFPQYIPYVAWLNLLALPFIVFSISYQGLVVKQWCVLCLSVMGLLLLEFTGAMLGQFAATNVLPELSIAFIPVLNLTLLLLLVAASWFLLKPVLIQIHESKSYKYELARLKNNREIFESILSKQTHVSGTEGLGITLGNLQSPNTILKICNPYCNPCAEAHKDLSRILDDNLNARVQIIYNSSVSHLDAGREPVRHFMATAQTAGLPDMKALLDQWYFSKNKNFENFSALHPVGDDMLEKQDEKIKAMFAWTRANHITATPTYFFNGRKLPSQYKITDLEQLLSN
nr:vitamin K epoxide reductase family protein [uncultured Dyadobacter sp.]